MSIFDLLEPGAKHWGDSVHESNTERAKSLGHVLPVYPDMGNVAACSSAISLKRIADALDDMAALKAAPAAAAADIGRAPRGYPYPPEMDLSIPAKSPVAEKRTHTAAVVATPDHRDWSGMSVTFEDGTKSWYPMDVFHKTFTPVAE